MSAVLSSPEIGTYVYCIARAESLFNGGLPFRAHPVGAKRGSVRVVQFMDLAAVVSDAPATRYDVSRENTMAHQLVVEEAMVHSDVLPVRFSTIAKNDQDVEDKLLRRKFGEFHRLLRYVHARGELGVKVFWQRERLFAEITADDARIRALRDGLAGKPSEETHYERIQLGQLTEEVMARRRDREAEAILAVLRPLAVELKVNKVLTDMMIVNAAFLVDRNRERDFDKAVNEIDETQRGRLIVKYAGPLPAYNFVNVVVHWEED